ncbi:hypothetical protein BSPLISOX_2650 [uncultured Gammaproteobacteria bacterium]|jgi:hypothetical protein|nr:hypothetical protein BSPCLSOX_1410 [uncultured Gammaproteobacteria bacterium]VVH65570.1 hypothetical protein BSPLISOX_2650 [uncultured Gammaproteobacteria bacterium]VVM27081.1 hypothetical protein BSPWISOXPB_974 [uncultured Gammaproteobacteria bacterium]
MSTRVFRFTIEVFWVDDKKYSDDLIETIDLYDELEVMIKIVRPDLDDLEFMGGSYELNQSNINYFEKKLGRKFDLKKYVYDLARYDFEGTLIN